MKNINTNSDYQVVYPEMGGKVNTGNQVEFKVGYGCKFYLTTDLDLKGRGIEQVGDGSNHKRGLKTFTATKRAMETIKANYKCAYIALL